MYFLITNREIRASGPGRSLGPLSYWLPKDDTAAPEQPKDLENWKTFWKPAKEDDFIRAIAKYVDKFPHITEPSESENQKHLTLFIHGYNNDWKDAVRRYHSLHSKLYTGENSLGALVLFTWPSDGLKSGYYPDRVDARRAAPDLADVLYLLYRFLSQRQQATMDDPKKQCHVQTSVIAHSMGAFLLQKAMQAAWTRANQPALISLIQQLLLVAADVDNDLFRSGETSDRSDGDAIANLCYRVTALFTGRDSVLGTSAGIKHFGKRRLGRSGLDHTVPKPDNVWAFDCTKLIPADHKNIHSSYFEVVDTIELLSQIIHGRDRYLLLE